METTKQRTGAAYWAELARLEKAASPAPWVTVRNNHADLLALERLDGLVSSGRVVWSKADGWDTAYIPAGGPDDGNADAALIVAARNALPHLLAAVARARASDCSCASCVMLRGIEEAGGE